MKLPNFMKLMECSCGWKLYSMYAKATECPKCYKKVIKEVQQK